MGKLFEYNINGSESLMRICFAFRFLFSNNLFNFSSIQLFNTGEGTSKWKWMEFISLKCFFFLLLFLRGTFHLKFLSCYCHYLWSIEKAYWEFENLLFCYCVIPLLFLNGEFQRLWRSRWKNWWKTFELIRDLDSV